MTIDEDELKTWAVRHPRDERVCIMGGGEGVWRYLEDPEDVTTAQTCKRKHPREQWDDVTAQFAILSEPPPQPSVEAGTMAAQILKFPARGIEWPVPVEVGNAIAEHTNALVSMAVDGTADAVRQGIAERLSVIHTPVESDGVMVCSTCYPKESMFPCHSLAAIYPSEAMQA